jgi:hypothetical protein
MSMGHLVLAIMAVVGLMTVATGTALAQDGTEVTISGLIEHGVPGTPFDPTELSVTLNLFEGITSFDQVSTTPKPNGAFEFSFSSAPDRTYFVGVEYQGVRYSDTRNADDVAGPMFIEVFDATNNSSVLTFDSYTVIITGALVDESFVEILERAVVRNDSNLTLAPNQGSAEPTMPSFLRFALPSGYYNLDVRSSLVGGEVLEVDRGFAMTTPVLPTRDEPHQIEFVYRLDYDESTADLSRTMRFGADSFRFVVPDETALPASPQLEDLGVAELNGRLLRLLEAQDIADDQLIELTLSELPMPTFRSEVTQQLSGWYFGYAVPGFVAVALMAILGYVMRKRRLSVDVSPGANLNAQREALLVLVKEIEMEHEHGFLTDKRYASRRGELKRALVDLELQQRLGASPTT